MQARRAGVMAGAETTPTQDDNLAPRAVGGRSWPALGYYNAYRQVLALLLVALTNIPTDPQLLGGSNPLLFAFASIAYLAIAVASRLLITSQRPPFTAQVIFHLSVDIAALTLLMHASGGLDSGLGMLLMITVAAGGLLLIGDLAILFAALASLALLGEQVFAQLYATSPASYMQAGILGTLFFTIAIGAQWIARRLKASEALAEQRGIDLANLAQLNDYVIHRLQSGIVVVDTEGRVRLLNHAARTMMGLRKGEMPDRLHTLSPGLDERLATWHDDPTSDIPPLRTADDPVEVICRFARVGSDAAVLIFLDDSSTHERQLQQMKQATLGRLTGSIAHEIRNPLSAIHHAAQLLDEANSGAADTSRLIAIIRQHVKRVDEIIRSILQLSRHSGSKRDRIVLKMWVADFVDEFCSLEGAPRDRIAIEIDPAEKSVEFDIGQLHQVMTNLFQNALRHGHNPNSPHDILIRGGQRAGIRGPYLEVVDGGPGIDTEVASHIFEPFYTNDSRGSGLGLYIARALCEHNFARLDYMPHRGGGAFRIRFAELPTP